MELREQVKKYLELKQQIDELTAQAKELNSSIIETMENMGETKYADDYAQASVVYKTNIKYTDERKLIELLKADESTRRYVVESIDSKGLNELIKSSQSVATKLNESYVKTTTSSLTVKRV